MHIIMRKSNSGTLGDILNVNVQAPTSFDFFSLQDILIAKSSWKIRTNVPDTEN